MLRVDLKTEQMGLDFAEHGGAAYSQVMPYEESTSEKEGKTRAMSDDENMLATTVAVDNGFTNQKESEPTDPAVEDAVEMQKTE